MVCHGRKLLVDDVYTTIAGWMLAYLFYMIREIFSAYSDGNRSRFKLIGSAGANILFMLIICILGFGVCSLGLQMGLKG